MLNGVFVSLDITAAENGSALRDPDGVKHAVAIKEVIRTTGKELRVWAVANVSAIQAWWERSLYYLTFCGRKLVYRGEV